MSDAPGATAAPGAGPPAAPSVSSTRLVATLAVGGALAGALLVVVFQLTQPTIAAYKERRLQEAVAEVLQQPARFETLWLVDGRLEREPPGGPGATAERVHLGWRADGTPAGFAVASSAPGYADAVRLMFGYDPATRRLLGMTVLETKETPGLGDRIEHDDFRSRFPGAEPPLVAVKAGRGSGDPGEVDAVTGATISSRAVIRAINDGLERVGPALHAWSPAAAGAEGGGP